MKIFTYISILTLIFASSCSESNYSAADEEGMLKLTAGVADNLTMVTSQTKQSRADSESLLQSLRIKVVRGDGTQVQDFYPFSDDPDNVSGEIELKLRTAEYSISGWAGDSVPASWSSKYYKGQTKVAIQPNATVTADLSCKIANVVSKVRFDDEIFDYLDDIMLRIGHSKGELLYASKSDNLDNRGYFMMPSKETELHWKLTGNLPNKQEFNLEGVQKVEGGHLYDFHFAFNSSYKETGGAAIILNVIETSLLEENSVQFRTAPSISAYEIYGDSRKEISTYQTKGININDLLPNYALVVRSSGIITHAIITSENNFAAQSLQEGIELINNFTEETATLRELGFEFEDSPVYNEATGTSEFEIRLGDKIMSGLQKGLYSFALKVEDYDGINPENKLSKETSLRMRVTGDGSIALETSSASIEPNRAILTGTSNLNGLTEVGFKIREKNGGVEWANVEMQPVILSTELNKGDNFTLEVKGLLPETTYEYITVAGDGSGDYEDCLDSSVEFSTFDFQLPNSDFEKWVTYNSCIYPAPSFNELFWDSGNEGGKLAGTTLTQGSTKFSHPAGGTSAELKSKKAAVFGIGKFAAGNLFIGKFLDTDGMDGVLGWGRPFTYRPTELQGWYHYTNGAIDEVASNAPSEYKKGDMDRGIIYIALLDNNSRQVLDSDKNYQTSYPVIARTKSSGINLFNKDHANVIAHGEIIFNEATVGDEMVPFSIKLDYKEGREDDRPSYILLVASASKGGDYYTGSTSSVLYLDDFRLVY